MPSNNYSQYNKLNIDTLRLRALRWAQYYNSFDYEDKDSGAILNKVPRIQRIALYKSGLGVTHSVKYVLVFELPQFKKSKKTLLYHQKTLQQLIEWEGGPPFLDEDFFDDIYIKKPKDEPTGEWLFRHISPDEDLQIPEIIPESMIVLYEEKILTDPNTAKKLRPSQIHKNECRKIAAKLWEKHPDMTIVAMIGEDEIINVTQKRDGNYYLEKTIRDWIKDLCPNRLPGRRRRT